MRPQTGATPATATSPTPGQPRTASTPVRSGTPLMSLMRTLERITLTTTIHTAVRPRWVEELSIWISFSHFYPFLLQSQQSPGVTGGLGLASLK